MVANRDFIQKLTYNVNNGGTLELIQRGHDGGVMIVGGLGKTDYISNGDMVMLINFYRYIKDHDIQHDFINPYGKNKEI